MLEDFGMAERLNFEKIVSMRIGDVIGRTVVFKNPTTGRKCKGKITAIAKHRFRVVDLQSLSRWVAWEDVGFT
jgi:hypothetical protein